jgi:hypothetical protein
MSPKTPKPLFALFIYNGENIKRFINKEKFFVRFLLFSRRAFSAIENQRTVEEQSKK